MIRREAALFLVVGSTTVAVDLCAYLLLLGAGLPVDWAKGIGFVVGMAFAYVANRLWTFGHVRPARASLLRFIVLYLATLLLNVAANHLVLILLAGWMVAVPLAFLVATGASAVSNFIGMKFFVFRVSVAS
jgi:putative flippase GtrA